MDAPTTPALPAPMPELASALGGWFSRAAELIADSGLAGPAERLAGIRAALTRAGFRAVVLGEFSRGKTTLVNHLLGGPVLPPGTSLPVPVAVSAGSAGCLELPGVDGIEHVALAPPGYAGDPSRADHGQSPLGPELIQRLRAVDPGRGELVRLRLAHPLLDGADVELVDTPGDDGYWAEPRSGAWRLVTSADAAIVVVAANAPLSLSEVALLRDRVLDAGVPRIILAVTKLDLVEPPEWDRVLARIRTKVDGIDPRIRVASVGAPADEDPAAKVRGWLLAAADPGPRRRARAVQAAAQLAHLLRGLSGTAVEAARLSELDAAQRAASLSEARQGLDAEVLLFDEYRIELRRRQGDVARRFRDRLAAARTDVADAVRYDLHRCGDPRTWWERDMPRRLHRELTAVARLWANRLRAAVLADVSWYEAEVSQRFDDRTPGPGPVFDELIPPAAPPTESTVPYLRTRKLVYRVGPTTAALAGAVLVPGIGPIAMIGASVAGTLLTEIKLRSELEHQREQVARQLDALVRRVMDEFADRVERQLRDVYDELVERTARIGRTWYADRIAAMESVLPDPDDPSIPDWTQIAARGEDLASAIDSVLDPPAGGRRR